jgi:hypothetical protein
MRLSLSSLLAVGGALLTVAMLGCGGLPPTHGFNSSRFLPSGVAPVTCERLPSPSSVTCVSDASYYVNYDAACQNGTGGPDCVRMKPSSTEVVTAEFMSTYNASNGVNTCAFFEQVPNNSTAKVGESALLAWAGWRENKIVFQFQSGGTLLNGLTCTVNP